MCRFQGRQKNKIAFLFYFLNAYRPTDSGTFYGLKIGPLLAEIQPVLYRKVNFYIIAIKTNTQNMSVYFFFFCRPTDWKSWKQEKNSCSCDFFLFYIFDRPTVPKRLEKNPPSNESTEHGLTCPNEISICVTIHVQSMSEVQPHSLKNSHDSDNINFF